MNIERLLKPKKLAVVGASERAGFGCDACRTVMTYMAPKDYYFISPTRKSVFGVPCYARISALPEPVDLVVLCTPAHTVEALVREAAQSGAGAAVVFASGFGESDAAGREAERRLIALCRELDFALMGPNCAGFINTIDRMYPFAFVAEERDRRGRVGVVSQSGQFVLSLMDNPLPRFSYAISAGNARIVTMEDYLDFLVDDPDTVVAALYLEGVNDPERFLSALEKAARRHKPVVILKAGRSEKGARLASSHTGSLSGADRVFDAVFDKYGVIRVDDLEELMATAQALSVLPALPAGDGVAALALSGGETGICADLGAELGLRYPDFAPETLERLTEMLPLYAHAANPLDMTATLSYDTGKLFSAYSAILDDPSVDMLVIGYTLLEEIVDPAIVYLCEAVEMLKRRGCQKPVLMLPFMENTRNREYLARLERAGCPVLPTGRCGLRVVRHIARFSMYSPEKHAFPKRLPRSWDGGRTALSESESRAILEAAGVPYGKCGLARSQEEAAALFESLGLSMAVLKVDSRDIPHKTDAGCVALNVGTPAEAAEAYARILNNALAWQPDAQIRGVQVAEQIEAGVEIIVGMTNDPQLGPCVLCGLGGVFTEIFHDAAMALCPVTRDEALGMLHSIKASKLFSGWRGGAPLDTEALAALLQRVSALALERLDDMAELDINPVYLYEHGVCAVDALYMKKV